MPPSTGPIVFNYLKTASEDPLFARIVMTIWGLPFVSILVYSLLHIDRICPDCWLIVFPIAIGGLGLFLLFTAVYSDDASVERRTEFVSDGGELLGLVLVGAVIVLAIPIWESMKRLRSGR